MTVILPSPQLRHNSPDGNLLSEVFCRNRSRVQGEIVSGISLEVDPSWPTALTDVARSGKKSLAPSATTDTCYLPVSEQYALPSKHNICP